MRGIDEQNCQVCAFNIFGAKKINYQVCNPWSDMANIGPQNQRWPPKTADFHYILSQIGTYSACLLSLT